MRYEIQRIRFFITFAVETTNLINLQMSYNIRYTPKFRQGLKSMMVCLCLLLTATSAQSKESKELARWKAK